MGPFAGVPANANHRLLSAAASNNATNVIARRVALKSIRGHNAKVSAVYLKLYDKATAPASTDTPLMTVYLPASASFALDYDCGQEFQLGLGYRIVTGNADADDTAVVAGDILALNIGYAV